MARILITHATRAGSTTDVAGILAAALRESGHDVALAAVRDDPSPGGHDLVVAGSGINAALWYSEATGWLARNAQELAGRTALFCVCLNAADPARHDEALGYNRAAVRIVEPLSQAAFAGRYVPEQVNLFKRLFLRSMRTEPKDHVDPAAIRAWADQLDLLVPAV